MRLLRVRSALVVVVAALALVATACGPLPPTTNFRVSFGSMTYGTWDGGSTWHATGAPTYPGATWLQVDDITFGPTRTLIAVGTVRVDPGVWHGVIWTSTNGGTNWTVVADEPPTSPEGGTQFNAVSCNASTCAAIGFQGADLTNGVLAFGFVDVSTDGGVTWAPTAGTIEDATDYVAVAPSGTIVVGATYPGTCIGTICAYQHKASLWRSADLGASWSRVYLSPPIYPPDQPTLDIDDSNINGVVDAGGTFVAIGNLWGEPSAELRSTDDGLTWTAGPATFSPLTLIANGRHVVMLTSGGEEISEDAGLTFHAPSGSPPTIPYDYSLRMATRSTGIVLVGRHQDGTFFVATSNDSGNTWAPKTVPSGVTLTAPGPLVAL